MPRPRVLVAAPLVGDHVAAIREIAEVEQASAPHGMTNEELMARIVDKDAVVALLTHRIDEALLAGAPALRVVANHAVGIDNVDLSACKARGVVVTNTPGVLTEATADLAFGLIIDASRRITEGDRLLRAGGFLGWAPTFHLGRPVSGATLGIIGFGSIGRAVARRAAGFGMKVVFASPDPVEGDLLGATKLDLDDLVAIADVVSLHAPLTNETRGLMSRTRLGRMKRGAVLVNTARGPLVDEKALADLLASGHLAGAALDVYVGEPNVDPALLAAPRLVLAPHIGSADESARDAMARTVCEAVVDVLLGRPPRNRVA